MKKVFLQQLATDHANGLSEYEAQAAVDDYLEGAKEVLRLAHDLIDATRNSYLSQHHRGSIFGPDPAVLRLLDELQEAFTLT